MLFGAKEIPPYISKTELKAIYQNELEVDLHNLSLQDAIKHLREIIKNCNNTVKNITIIHGFHSGTALKTGINKQVLKNSRIRHIVPTLNKGKSIIIFKTIEENK